MKLIHLNQETNKLCIYLSEKTINTKFDWKIMIYSKIYDFLSLNKNGICQIKLNIQDYKAVLRDLLDCFDLRFPRRIYISWD